MNIDKSSIKILIVDDEKNICDACKKALERIGFNVKTTMDSLDALRILQDESFDIIICDVKLPRMDGIELLQRIKEINSNTIVIMITAFADVKTAVKSIKLGAYEYICKPFNPEQIRVIVNKALKQKMLLDENIYLKQTVKGFYLQDVVIGKSQEMHDAFRLVKKVSNSDSSILILGETGVGKEVVARMIHFDNKRKDNPFVIVNCAAIPDNLFESELFGHRKGAFTGAEFDRKGSFEIAHNGTIFLDEISEMPLNMQAKILRVIENGEFKKVGSEEMIRVDVRIIAATNKNPEDEISKGTFREDLYYRLNVVQIHIPPLRTRKVDIPIFANHFLSIYNKELKKVIKDFSDDAMQFMKTYRWPGNIRELKNSIERAVLLTEEDIIRRSDFSQKTLKEEPELKDLDSTDNIPSLHDMELDYIKKVIGLCGGNKAKAARLLGITPVTIWRKLEEDNKTIS
ncbi:MAG: sigma-54-dependent transcriptional regulator [Nitrospinota bacterium]